MIMQPLDKSEDQSILGRLKRWWRRFGDETPPPPDAWEENWEEAIRSTCVALAAGCDRVELISLVIDSDVTLNPLRILRLISIAEVTAAKFQMYASVRTVNDATVIRVSAQPLDE
jgi:hypothetical protein